MKKPKTIKLLDTNFVECVPWSHIKARWGKREYNRFEKWMSGQTCLIEGAYMTDILNYAAQKNKGIKNPQVYD